MRPPLLTIEHVAQRLGSGRSVVYELARSGELPAVVVRDSGNKKMWRFREEALEAFIHEREQGGAGNAQKGPRRSATK
jgi:excisionase family DNA binding protein